MVSESNERSMAAVAEKVPRPCFLCFCVLLPRLRLQTHGGVCGPKLLQNIALLRRILQPNFSQTLLRAKANLTPLVPTPSRSHTVQDSKFIRTNKRASARFPFEKRADALCTWQLCICPACEKPINARC